MTGIDCKYIELGGVLQVSEIVYTILLVEEAGNTTISVTNR